MVLQSTVFRERHLWFGFGTEASQRACCRWRRMLFLKKLKSALLLQLSKHSYSNWFCFSSPLDFRNAWRIFPNKSVKTHSTIIQFCFTRNSIRWWRKSGEISRDLFCSSFIVIFFTHSKTICIFGRVQNK